MALATRPPDSSPEPFERVSPFRARDGRRPSIARRKSLAGKAPSIWRFGDEPRQPHAVPVSAAKFKWWNGDFCSHGRWRRCHRSEFSRTGRGRILCADRLDRPVRIRMKAGRERPLSKLFSSGFVLFGRTCDRSTPSVALRTRVPKRTSAPGRAAESRSRVRLRLRFF